MRGKWFLQCYGSRLSDNVFCYRHGFAIMGKDWLGRAHDENLGPRLLKRACMGLSSCGLLRSFALACAFDRLLAEI